MITVGINSQGVFYASSSATGSQAAPAAATLSPDPGVARRCRQHRPGRWIELGLERPRGRRLDHVHRLGADDSGRPARQGPDRPARPPGRLPDRRRRARRLRDDRARRRRDGPERATSRSSTRAPARSCSARTRSSSSPPRTPTTPSAAPPPPRPLRPPASDRRHRGIRSIFVFASANLPADDIVLKLFDPHGSVGGLGGHGHEPGGGHLLEAGRRHAGGGHLADPGVPVRPRRCRRSTTAAPGRPAPTRREPDAPNPAVEVLRGQPAARLLGHRHPDRRLLDAQDGATPPCDRDRGQPRLAGAVGRRWSAPARPSPPRATTPGPPRPGPTLWRPARSASCRRDRPQIRLRLDQPVAELRAVTRRALVPG